MKLYDMLLSGNCYKIRLFCGLLGLEYETVPIDLARQENRSPEFLQLNPRGQLPVLQDGEIRLWDSTAILVYLARQYGAPHWLPLEPSVLAEVMQWLALAQNELLYGLARARAANLFGRPWDIGQCQELGKRGLAVLEQRLENREWLANGRISIADIACYPYVALASQAGIALDEYRHIGAWLQRIGRQPGYVGMPGL
ncbi:glutathione S-transferase family protein [Methylomonas sp. UP202]|uniref:glutathione S-transferase family protein n=1 Tax=Methylomonas sp. UP202 TaxID=3040943 RepID=UPI00247AEB14|nr:glutathione S-transferase family protein [Methylomonas sp. UP202]WGS87480.1 glutathione S-transferase family protein [Methylomonas sp. UP202]